MKCTDFENKVHEFIDDELDHVSSLTMTKHIDDCAGCKALYDELLELKVCLSNLDELDLPANFNEELHEKLLEVANENKVVSLSRKLKQYKVLVSVAALVLISVVAIKVTDFSFRGGSNDLRIAADESYNVEVANDMARSESYEVAEESDEESVEAGQLKMFSMPIVEPIITTSKEVKIDMDAPMDTIATYLTDHDYNADFNENTLTLLIKDNAVDAFIVDIKANFNIISETYLDNTVKIDEMKLLEVEYKEALLEIRNSMSNTNSEEEKTRLESELEYYSKNYDKIRDELSVISMNTGISKVILSVISE